MPKCAKIDTEIDEIWWFTGKGGKRENYLFYSSFEGFGGAPRGAKEAKKRRQFEAEKRSVKKREKGWKRGAKREAKMAEKRKKGEKKGVEKRG